MANHFTGPQSPGGAGGPERHVIIRKGQPLPHGPLQIALGRLQEYMINTGDRAIPDVLGFLSETTSVLNYVQGTVQERQRNVTADQDEHRGLGGANSPLPKEFTTTRAAVRLMNIPRLRSVLAELAGTGNHRSKVWNPQTQAWTETDIPELGSDTVGDPQRISLTERTTLRNDLAAYRAQEAHTDPKLHITIDLVQIGSTREVKSLETVSEEHLIQPAAEAGVEVPSVAPRYINDPREREFYMIIRIPGKDPKTQYALVFSPHTLGAIFLYPPQPDGLTPQQRQENPSRPYFKPELIGLLEESYNAETGEGLVVVPNARFITPERRRGLRTFTQRVTGQHVPDLIDSLFDDPLFRGDPVMDGTDIYKQRWIHADHFDLSFT